MSGMNAGYDGDTNGIIIGGFFTRYEFWCKHPEFGWLELLAREYFESDDEAHQWVKERFPAEYRRGIEVRCFDQPGKREQAIIDARKPRNT